MSHHSVNKNKNLEVKTRLWKIRELQENLCQRFNEKIHQYTRREPHKQSREFEPFFDRYRLLKIDLKILMMADWLKVFNKIINTLVFKIKLSVRFNSKIFNSFNVTSPNQVAVLKLRDYFCELQNWKKRRIVQLQKLYLSINQIKLKYFLVSRPKMLKR